MWMAGTEADILAARDAAVAGAGIDCGRIAMVLGRVIGTAVATRKYPGLEGAKLLVVQELSKELQPRGRPAVAVDVAQAGVGDW